MGKFSLPIGLVACSFVALMVPILCFPSTKGSDLDAAGMNWTCVVYGGPMFLVMVWWVLGARKWFKGPKVNLEHVMPGTESAYAEQIQAKEVNGDSSSSTDSLAQAKKA